MNITGHFTFSPFSLSFFRSLPPSIICLTPPSLPPPSCFLNLSLSLCEGHAIDFPLSIHFSRLALKRGKQTKATPAPPRHRSALLHLFLSSSSSLCRPSSRPKKPTSERGGARRNAPSSTSPNQTCIPPHHSSPPSPPSLHSLHLSPLRPPLPFSWVCDHVPLTELKSCITLKTLPMHCG